MARKPDLYVATSTGVVAVDGKRVEYASGRTIVRAGHPILAAAPGKFRPFDDVLEVPRPTRAAK